MDSYLKKMHICQKRDILLIESVQWFAAWFETFFSNKIYWNFQPAADNRCSPAVLKAIDSKQDHLNFYFPNILLEQ